MFDIKTAAENSHEETLGLVRALCAIPAPSGRERARAEYVFGLLREYGYPGAYIDGSDNAVCVCGQGPEYTLFMAHTDTVFPDTSPMPFAENAEKMYSPGVGDDTACLAVMLTALRILKENGFASKRGLIFAANSGEEGLGNLRGCRGLFHDFAGKITRMYTFDGQLSGVVGKSVGSHRYSVAVRTEGGHSFNAFGSRSAIDVLAKLIEEIYRIEPPKYEGTRTTYNVGTVEGGTSVNTIAEEARMLCEYRSDDVRCLAEMEGKFAGLFEAAKAKCLSLEVKKVGERPCMSGVDPDTQRKLTEKVAAIQKKYSGLDASDHSGSTDCNIPHSLGIPAVCSGLYIGGGAHTRGEWIEKRSLIPGLCAALELILSEGGVSDFGGAEKTL